MIQTGQQTDMSMELSPVRPHKGTRDGGFPDREGQTLDGPPSYCGTQPTARDGRCMEGDAPELDPTTPLEHTDCPVQGHCVDRDRGEGMGWSIYGGEPQGALQLRGPCETQLSAPLHRETSPNVKATWEEEEGSGNVEGAAPGLCRCLELEGGGVDGVPGMGEDMVPAQCLVLLPDDENTDRECPVCTEPYDAETHKQYFLNCNHTFCDNCLKTIADKANHAELGRVKCPICRQRTPMMQWEILKMQEQMIDNSGAPIVQLELPPEPPVRRPGIWGALEYRFQKRFYTTRIFSFAPCFHYPQGCVNCLRRLEGQCRCLYLATLVLLLLLETLCFFIIFLPIIILILFIVFAK